MHRKAVGSPRTFWTPPAGATWARNAWA